MLATSALAFLALPLLALGQSSSVSPASSSAAPAASGRPVIHRVIVGGNGLVFIPNFVTAAVGDSVRFTFLARNHSVVQRTFAAPCTAMMGGVSSGFRPYAGDDDADDVREDAEDGDDNDDMEASDPPVYNLPVTSVAPSWYFCSQGSHCTAGQVFAINPPTTGNTIGAFVVAAMQSGGRATSMVSSAVATGMQTVTSGTAVRTATAAIGSAASSAVASATAAPRSGASALQVGSGLVAGAAGIAMLLV